MTAANLNTKPLNRFLQTDIAAIGAIILLWIIAEILIKPIGEFPLNDDWSYTQSLRHLYQQHQFKLEGWTSMPLIGQLIWAWLFCKVFGFSFTVLRLSTIILGLAGAIGTYKLCREFTTHKMLALIAALTLLLNPIWCNLSNTFMTDTPFTTIQIFAIYFFVRYLKTGKSQTIIPGLIFIIWATMIRQLGLLAAGAFSIAVIIKFGMRPKAILHAVTMILLPLCIYLGFNAWLRITHNYPSKYDEGFKRVAQALFSHNHSTARLLFRQSLIILVYTGFFVFPICLFVNWRRIRKKWPTFSSATIAFIAFTAIYCFAYKPVMPVMGNILNGYGIGAVSLRDVSVLQINIPAPLPPLFWQICTALGILAAGAVLLTLAICLQKLILQAPSANSTPSQPLVLNGFSMPFAKIRELFPGKQPLLSPQLAFLLIFICLYFIMLLVGGTYDRYILPLIPATCVLLIACAGPHLTLKRHNYLLACILLLAYGAFSIAGTRDYFSWNKARWDAIAFLTQEKHIPANQIDGGFEFNGYYGYNESDMTSIKEKADPTQKSWWWVENDEYLITRGPVDNYETIRTFSFNRHLGPSAPTGNTIYVLHKTQ